MSLAELGTVPGKVETIEQVGHYIDDPLAAFSHLCAERPNALLLESAEIESKDNLQSLLMVVPQKSGKRRRPLLPSKTYPCCPMACHRCCVKKGCLSPQ